MYQAIIDDKHEFVKLFLENGFVLKNFVTYRRLLKLYNEIPKNSHFFLLLDKIHRNEKDTKHLLKKFKQSEANPIFTFKLIGSVLHNLVDDIFKHKFSLSPFNQITSSQAEKILHDTVS